MAPDEPVDYERLLRGMATEGELVHLERIAGRPGRHRPLASRLPPQVADRVPAGGLWTHQALAIDLARSGRSVAVATGTASGKSLCYQLPVAEAAVGTEPSTALMVFPTKALAQDQLRSLTALDIPGLVAVTYDGDTAPAERAFARRHADVVLTNPDMLHVGILPNHGRWATFLMRLRYVVLDELHTLRGIFGTHVAHVLRRLRRLCARYGSAPAFIFSSATIGRPAELASALCGLDVAEVTDDGSPSGDRLFGLWNPALLDETTGTRASSNGETARLLAAVVEAGGRGIAFTRSRRGTELVAAAARRRLPTGLADTVVPYRGGYLAAERRAIEEDLFAGRARGVVATSALELGVDLGWLDACVLNGFPGTVASMWQQAGRAGRARQRSLAVLVAGEDALDQWFMHHPTEVFVRAPEPAVVNPGNPFILDPHLAAAAYEQPLTPDDHGYWGDDIEEAVGRLVHQDVAVVRDGRVIHAGPGSPAARVGLRTGTTGEVQIVIAPEGRLLGLVDEARAFTTVHPGAIYLHQGRHYRVERLDLDDRAAWVVPCDAEETTHARSETDIAVTAVDRSVCIGRAELHLGAVEVIEQVTGYRRKALFTGEIISDEELDLPPTTLVTRAFWYTVDERVLTEAGIPPGSWPGALHAAEHAGIGMLPLFTICDRWDVGGVSTVWLPDTGRPSIFIYDGYPGGAGIAELGFGAGRRHLQSTLDAVSGCPCLAGCPSCVQSPKCGNLNEPLDKAAAVSLLRTILAC